LVRRQIGKERAHLDLFFRREKPLFFDEELLEVFYFLLPSEEN